MVLEQAPSAMLAFPGRLTATSYELPEDLSYERWASLGEAFQQMERSVLWWLGDWWRFGERKYGDVASQATRDALQDTTGHALQSIKNAAWVADRFELSRRRDNLPWSHHAEVAGLPTRTADTWLDRADTEGWSRSELRRQMREAKYAEQLVERVPVSSPSSVDGPLPGVQPYYADDVAHVYLYHGDARELVPAIMAALAIDVVITDPPYGVALGTSKTTVGLFKDGRPGYAAYGDTYDEWRDLVLPILEQVLPDKTRRAAVFTGPHYVEQAKAVAIGGIYCSAAMGRHAWGFKNLLPILFYGADPRQEEGRGCHPTVLASNATAEQNGHPCPKPLPWLYWLVERASRPGEWIFDPFAGSGTTLQAAKACGRPAVGIEIDESYCAIAARGLAQAVLPLGIGADPAVSPALWTDEEVAG